MITLQSSKLSVTIDPDEGGKIASFKSIATGKEFLYQDNRTAFDASLGYSHRDISGYDECFPTIAADTCRDPGYQGTDFPDHGMLWQRAWSVTDQSDTHLNLRCPLPEIDCVFERAARLTDDTTLQLDYRIAFTGTQPLRYVYSAHPLLAAGPHARFELPPAGERAFAYLAMNTPGLTPESWVAWPDDAMPACDPPLTTDRHQLSKVILPHLTTGSAAVHHADVNQKLRIQWDTETLPHLGVLTVLGYDTLGDGHFTDQAFVGLEPSNGIADELAVCAREDTAPVLQPGSETRFAIRLRLEDANPL